MRRIMNISKGWVVLLLALPALDLRSAEVAPPAPDLVVFQKVDMNHDGKVSMQEARVVADLSAEFGTLDANHDDALSPAEFGRWSRAAELRDAVPSPATGPSGSNGSQHMPVQG